MILAKLRSKRKVALAVASSGKTFFDVFWQFLTIFDDVQNFKKLKRIIDENWR